MLSIDITNSLIVDFLIIAYIYKELTFYIQLARKNKSL